MSNNKTKKKDRKKQQKENQNSIAPDNVNSNLFSAEEMQHVIAKAIVEADEIKEQRIKEQQAKELDEWRVAIGKKDFSNKPAIIRYIRTFLNLVKCILKMPFVSEKRIKGDRASFALLQMCITIFFATAYFVTLIASLVLFFGGIGLLFIPLEVPVATTLCAWYIFIGIVCFFMAGMFRMASVEVQKIEDRNYLFGIFASVTSIVSIIIALITISKGG